MLKKTTKECESKHKLHRVLGLTEHKFLTELPLARAPFTACLRNSLSQEFHFRLQYQSLRVICPLFVVPKRIQDWGVITSEPEK